MSISSEVRKAGPFTGNGATTTFPFTFKVFQQADLLVVRQTISTGLETNLVLNTDYTVSLNADQNVSPGGTVTLPVALAATYNLTITSAVTNTQPTNLTNNGGFYPTVINNALDRSTILVQQLRERLLRSISYPVSDASNIATTLPASTQRATKVLSFDANGAPETAFSATDVQNAQANAASAAASAAAAAASQSAANISAGSAAASANAAQTAAQSIIWNDVVYVSTSTAINATYRGKLVVVDASSGPISITLPSIASLDLSTAFVLGIKKSDASGNQVTITPNGTDNINGSASKIIAITDAGTTLTPDIDPNPDQWNGMDFGAVAGNMIQDVFSGNASTTAFTLSTAPGTKNNTQVYISGVYQNKATYSISGTTLTFTSAPPTGTNNIEVITGTTLAAGIPSDSSVSTAKLSDASVTTQKIADANVTTPKIADSNITLAKLAAAVASSLVPAGSVIAFAGTAAPTGYLLCDGSSVSRSTYADLFSAISTRHGSGDGSTTFNLPDYRYVFLRGAGSTISVTGSGSASSNNATFTAHGINRTGMRVRLSSGTLSGLSTSTDYYAIVVDANTLAFADNYANAIAGTKRTITGSNSAVIVQWEDPDLATRLQAAVGGATSGVGTRQEDAFKSHTHTIGINQSAGGGGGNKPGAANVNAADVFPATSTNGGNETRPLNAYVNYIIKT